MSKMQQLLETEGRIRASVEEKYSPHEGKVASRGYLLKLARVMQMEHSTSFDERTFCNQYNVQLNKYK